MSATRLPRVRRADYYRTPAWCVRAIVPALDVHANGLAGVIDPCAGDGAILEACGDEWEAPRVGLELDAERAAAARAKGLEVETRDALGPDPWPVGARSIVLNPPYSQAESFVRRALEEVGAGGCVAALLRLAWLEGLKRVAFHREHPANVYVLPRRPSFTPPGTDATAYAWFVWSSRAPGGTWSILGGGA